MMHRVKLDTLVTQYEAKLRNSHSEMESLRHTIIEQRDELAQHRYMRCDITGAGTVQTTSVQTMHSQPIRVSVDTNSISSSSTSTSQSAESRICALFRDHKRQYVEECCKMLKFGKPREIFEHVNQSDAKGKVWRCIVAIEHIGMRQVCQAAQKKAARGHAFEKLA